MSDNETAAIVEPDDLELAALMCSRICHDVISPVGAIANGFEVLEEEKDEAMRQMALEIIQSNARKASARLQFARLAFGAMGSASDRFPLHDARRLCDGLYEDEKASLVWGDMPDALPKDKAKLLVNLVVIAAQAIPRGGEVSVAVEGGDEDARFTLVSTGPHAAVPRSADAIFAGRVADGRLDAHAVQPYYASRLARLVGMRVDFHTGEGRMEIMAAPEA